MGQAGLITYLKKVSLQSLEFFKKNLQAKLHTRLFTN